MISRILRNFIQVALDFATLNVKKCFPPYLQHGRTIGLLCKIMYMPSRVKTNARVGHFVETKGNLQQSKVSNAQKRNICM